MHFSSVSGLTAVHYTVHVSLQYRCPPAEFNHSNSFATSGGFMCFVWQDAQKLERHTCSCAVGTSWHSRFSQWLLQLLTTKVKVNWNYCGCLHPPSQNLHRCLPSVKLDVCGKFKETSSRQCWALTLTRIGQTSNPKTSHERSPDLNIIYYFSVFQSVDAGFFILTLFHVWVGAQTQRGAVHQHTNRNREVHKGSENWTSVFFPLSHSLLSSSVPKKAGAAPGHELKRDTWRRRGEGRHQKKRGEWKIGGGGIHVSPIWRHSPGGYIWSTINLLTKAGNRE